MIRSYRFCIFVFWVATSQSLHGQSAYNKIREMKSARESQKKNLAECLTAFQEKLSNEVETLRKQLGDTPLARDILAGELEAGRESPVTEKLSICSVPSAHMLQAGRILVKCKLVADTASIACLDVASNFLGEDLASTSTPLGVGEEFFSESADIKCEILKK